jgi:hypothetical protein
MPHDATAQAEAAAAAAEAEAAAAAAEADAATATAAAHAAAEVVRLAADHATEAELTASDLAAAAAAVAATGAVATAAAADAAAAAAAAVGLTAAPPVAAVVEMSANGQDYSDSGLPFTFYGRLPAQLSPPLAVPPLPLVGHVGGGTVVRLAGYGLAGAGAPRCSFYPDAGAGVITFSLTAGGTADGFVRAAYASALVLLLDVPEINLQIDEIEIDEITPASLRLTALIHVAGRASSEALVALRTLACTTADASDACAGASFNPYPYPYPYPCPCHCLCPCPCPCPYPYPYPNQVVPPPQCSALETAWPWRRWSRRPSQPTVVSRSMARSMAQTARCCA